MSLFGDLLHQKLEFVETPKKAPPEKRGANMFWSQPQKAALAELSKHLAEAVTKILLDPKEDFPPYFKPTTEWIQSAPMSVQTQWAKLERYRASWVQCIKEGKDIARAQWELQTTQDQIKRLVEPYI